MVDANVVSNGHLAWFAGPDSAISEQSWNDGPTLAELQALDNLSAGIKIDGTDFALEASDQVDDRSFADQAGAQSRGPLNAGGAIEVYTPGEGDTTSIEARAYETFGTPRTSLALVQRPVKPQGEALAPGDEINIFRIETDARAHNRNDASRTLGVGTVFKGQAHVGYIVPSATPTAPIVSTATVSVTVGGTEMVEVEHEGRNVTVGATYISSNENVAVATPGGIIYGVAAGAATIDVIVPGAAEATPISVTVA